MHEDSPQTGVLSLLVFCRIVLAVVVSLLLVGLAFFVIIGQRKGWFKWLSKSFCFISLTLLYPTNTSLGRDACKCVHFTSVN